MTTEQKHDDGGFAFPVPHAIDGNWNKEPFERYSGMSLRDYFAAAALTGIVSTRGRVKTDPIAEAMAAYILADAMLKEREK